MIAARPLEAAAFAPYGQVVASGPEGRWINDGHAWRSEAGPLSLAADGGRAALAVFRVRRRDAAGPWQQLERHRLGTQTFLPLAGGRCLIIVALGAAAPDPPSLAAFVSRAGQGWTLAPGTWHHALIALDDLDVAVLERATPVPAPDCDVVQLAAPLTIALPPPVHD